MNDALVPPRSYEKYNRPTCTRVTLDADGLDRVRESYREVRGQPIFIDDILHMNPRAADTLQLAKQPQDIRWAKNGSFLIIPNYAYMNGDDTEHFRHRAPGDRSGIILTAWYVHPAQLEESVFSESNCREDFRVAQALSVYVPQFAPSNRTERSKHQQRIRKIEEESGVQYYASVLDLTPADLPFLIDLRATALSSLRQDYRIRDDDRVSLYFHTLPPTETTTLHLHIRVNQGVHPLDHDKSIELDDLIENLKQGRTAKDMLLSKGYQHRHSSKTDDILGRSGMHHETIPNPFVIPSPYVSYDDCKRFEDHIRDAGVDVMPDPMNIQTPQAQLSDISRSGVLNAQPGYANYLSQ